MDVVIDSVDTIVEVNENIINSIPNRRLLKRGQTPQAFKKSVLKNAYDLFMQDTEKLVTDDCGIVLKYLPNEIVLTVNGDESNFKITHQQDIYLADNLLKDGLVGRLNNASNKIEGNIKNKVVIVIGASSGIGEELLKISAELGAIVFPFSRRLNKLDVTDSNSIKIALEDVFEKVGRIDYIINTTGLLNRKPLMTMTDKEVQDSYMTNYVGVINVARASFEYLKESRGMLINFASSSYTRGRSNYSIYSSTKAAIVNFTQAIAEEWLSHGIRVNVINPERTATPMRVENFGSEAADTLLTSREVAEFTLSAMSFEYTGQIFTIKNDF